MYASTQNGAGITANANMAKGNGNGETTTNTNSHINVGGTTYQNIGGNLVLDGAVVKGDYATGHIGGRIIATSRQDTAKYDGKQKNVGFSADVSMQGIPQNVSLNGGKSNLSMNSAQVTEQTGLQYQSSDMVVDGKSSFNGAYFTTATPQANQTQFKGGLEVSDIQNHIHYHGQSISGGIGAGLNANKTGLASPSISGIGYGKVGDSDTSTTYGAVTGMAGQSQVTNKTVDILNEPLRNTFNAGQLNAELNNQTQITQAFGQEAPKMVGDYAGQKQLELIHAGNTEEAEKWGEGGVYRVALHTATGLLTTGAVEGALTTGGVATIAPKLNEWQDKLTTKLIEKGFEKDTAESVSKFTLNLTIATAGTTAGLDTSSTAYALNADMNNRQLHPDEKKLATKLAQELKKPKYKSFVRPNGQPYTLEDVENALRWANINSTKYKEKYTDNIKVVLKEGTNANTLMYDEYGWSKPSVEGSSVVYYQHLNTAKRPNEQLISFIQAHTPKGTKYTWDNNARIPYMPTSLPKKPTTTPSSPVKKVVEAPKYPQTALDRQNETIKRTGIDFNGGKVAQSKSEKIINEQVMPVVQTGVGLAEVGTGTAMCATGVGCGVGSALIIHGSDNAVTGNANRGKTTNQQTSSVLLTQGVGLSEGTASNIKMGTDLALGGVTAAQGVGRRVASGASGTGTTIGKHTDDTLTKVGDWDLENVSNYGNPNTPADRIIATEKSNHTKELKDLGVEKIGQLPHYDDKHGAYTSLQDQYDRAMTGTNKTLSEKGYPPGKPVNASKFFNSTDMEYAMRQAEKMYAENPKKYIYEKNQVTINFDRPVGEGFIKNNKTTQANGTAGEYRWSNTAIVGIDPKTGKAYTAFPNMDEGYKQENQLLDFIKK